MIGSTYTQLAVQCPTEKCAGPFCERLTFGAPCSPFAFARAFSYFHYYERLRAVMPGSAISEYVKAGLEIERDTGFVSPKVLA